MAVRQWDRRQGTGRIIEIIHVPNAAEEAKIAEIADYFVKKFDQEAVGRQIIEGLFTLITPRKP